MGTLARPLFIAKANAAAAAKIKIVTISVGLLADKALMQQVADIGGGIHFNVPAGTSIATVRTQLQAVFREIASSRPLKLVDAN